MRKQIRKRYLSKKSFTHKIYVLVCLLLGELSLSHNLQLETWFRFQKALVTRCFLISFRDLAHFFVLFLFSCTEYIHHYTPNS